MRECLICQSPIEEDITWSNFLLPSVEKYICEKCEQRLELIGEEICKKCGRKMESAGICSDCAIWNNHPVYQGVFKQNRAVFQYTPFMQEVIAQWKFRGDYQMIEVFRPYIIKEYRKYFGKVKAKVTPIPLTEERLHERAFNQAEAIAKVMEIPIENALARKPQSSEKQSKKSRRERIQSENPFILTKSLNSPVILVDDIYTTGMTIHHAAKMLTDDECSPVYSFTLIR
ncbi:competence protein ComFC [Gracilibacillus ureilyticus]|uniref:Competence protein ComFC n=1 Tax=Gracilibacillus ureilyticus TaxID=531814 RepID=A0A1H9NYI0_9BACI|nr:ComF family protein [Gracilibacillus ureilyticus]SER40921.1 competence protein ComFC [Gracilibacillus ureilyticus]